MVSFKSTDMDDVNYMLLDLDKVEVRELFRLLFHKHIGARTFINSNEDELLFGTFWRRFVIFISILIIKGLKLISHFMERLGCFIESSFNLWTEYDSFYMLVFNTFRGKNVELCRESPNFSSIIGLTDTRLELDDQIPREDPRYRSALAIMASKTAYENQARIQKIVQDHWKMEYLGFYNCANAFNTGPISSEKEHPTQAFIFSDKSEDQELICVSFRGTSPLSADDWCTDLDLSWFNIDGIGKVHMGFLKALGLQKNNKKYIWLPKELIQDKGNENTFAYYKIRQVLKETLEQNKNARFIVTGHSLGGALAVLFPAILAFHNEFELLERLEGVYTFGQPRVGNDEFCRFMDELLGVKRYFRFVYANDIVPRIPFDDNDFKFKHFGYCYYFNSFYNGKLVNEEPNKNYFSIKSIGPMYLNAIFEMVRGFVLPYAYGRNYKEGILLMGVRLFGLIIPGTSAHCPQDYVNLTRLTSPDIFDALQYN
ncbi:triacylglycerol lipase OBL1-like [Rutidosis leptorrhynchoides]|uniref:triacylglycerol lipase OBL1-like n=1 Tax=Rutidosis leptorrhynchoides TaxID=125765 RepID=UPI003A9917B1